MPAQLVQLVPRERLVLPDLPDLQGHKVPRACKDCLEVPAHRDFKVSKEYRALKVQLVRRVQLGRREQRDLLKFQSEQLFLDKRFKEELGRRCPQVLSELFLLEKNILFI